MSTMVVESLQCLVQFGQILFKSWQSQNWLLLSIDAAKTHNELRKLTYAGFIPHTQAYYSWKYGKAMFLS